MYEAIINNRKRVINILNRCIKKELIDVNELKGYFPTIEIKKKNDIIERMYDVMMQSMTNNMCASGEDVYDFPSASEEEFIEIIQVFHQGLSVVLNIFLNDVSIIEECSERISELIFTDIANKIYYN